METTAAAPARPLDIEVLDGSTWRTGTVLSWRIDALGTSWALVRFAGDGRTAWRVLADLRLAEVVDPDGSGALAVTPEASDGDGETMRLPLRSIAVPAPRPGLGDGTAVER